MFYLVEIATALYVTKIENWTTEEWNAATAERAKGYGQMDRLRAEVHLPEAHRNEKLVVTLHLHDIRRDVASDRCSE